MVGLAGKSRDLAAFGFRNLIAAQSRTCVRFSGSGTHYADSEFGRLRRIVVGRPEHFRLPSRKHDPMLDNAASTLEYDDDGNMLPPKELPMEGKAYPPCVIETAKQTLDELVAKIHEFDPSIEVLRSNIDGEKGRDDRYGNRGYSTRDVMMVIEDKMYITPSYSKGRATEAEDCYAHILDTFGPDKVVDLRTKGYWNLVNTEESNLKRVSDADEDGFLRALKHRAQALDAGRDPADVDASKAALKAPQYDKAKFFEGAELVIADFDSPHYFQDLIPDENPFKCTEAVPLFDAANILLVNSRQIIYLVSQSGNYSGLVYLKETMAKVGIEVIPIAGIYDGSHIDTTLALLNKDTVLFNEERFGAGDPEVALNTVHAILKNCGYPDKKSNYIGVSMDDMSDSLSFDPSNVSRPAMVPSKEMQALMRESALGSDWMGMNLIALSPDTLVVDAAQTKFIKKLESHGFKVVPVWYPFQCAMGGGIHCTTLPLLREPA